MTIRVGLIGAGVMGADHARILSTAVGGSALTAVSDADARRADAVAKAFGGSVIAEPEALIRDDTVDAVLIASPDPTHKPLVLACLAAGKPVLCEKPLATSTEDCLEIIGRETALGRRLVQVGFMRRFDPGYGAMKTRLLGGGLGKALMFHCIHRNAVAAPYSSSEGLIANSAVHEIDIARWLLDGEVARVTVVAPRPTSLAAMQDPQLVLLHMADGSVVDIEVFVNAQYGYDVRGELVCEKGTVSLVPPTDIVTREAGSEGFIHPADWRARFAAAYRLELQAWIDAQRDGTPVGASAWDGYAATAGADVGIEALHTGAPAEVRLEPRPSLYA
jgi:myo-inositol 2-dehydrogenase / D-chiro-inositol 1-dehydrogenase